LRALILAGGLGTRLRPLTYTRPKHLLPIANRPHVEHVFDLLVGSGIDGVVLLTSYLPDAFTEAIERARARGLEVAVTREAEPLGTAGALKNAEHLAGDDTFLAFNGDILTDVDLGAVVAFHRSRKAEGTILLTSVENPSAFGVVPTDDEGRVQGFIEKPPPDEAPTNLINAGIYVLEASVLERIPPAKVYSAEHQLFPGMVADGAPLFALATDAYWADIGTRENYLQANLDALEGRYRTDAVPEPRAGLVLADAAEIAGDARVWSSALGSGAVVEAGAFVERSVLLDGAKVSQGATVVDCVLGEGALVAAGAEAVERTIGDGEAFE
jgi:mannose-1-phosphate guanylyltransferase